MWDATCPAVLCCASRLGATIPDRRSRPGLFNCDTAMGAQVRLSPTERGRQAQRQMERARWRCVRDRPDGACRHVAAAGVIVWHPPTNRTNRGASPRRGEADSVRHWGQVVVVPETNVCFFLAVLTLLRGLWGCSRQVGWCVCRGGRESACWLRPCPMMAARRCFRDRCALQRCWHAIHHPPPPSPSSLLPYTPPSTPLFLASCPKQQLFGRIYISLAPGRSPSIATHT